jgi:hypothetical protein
MAGFPLLKTGAVAQYPITRGLRLQNQAVRFVDGSMQRYRDAAGALRRWTIRLDLLDEGELGAVEEFFLAQQGAYATFTFTDPWDGQDYDHCRLEGDLAALVSAGEMRGGTVLTMIQERR